MAGMIDRALESFAAWTFVGDGGSAAIVAAYGSIMGIFAILYLIAYLMLLRLRVVINDRRKKRVDAVWRPIIIQLITVPEEFQDVVLFPDVKGRERDDLMRLLSHFALRIPVRQRKLLRKIVEATGLAKDFDRMLAARSGWTRARAALMCGYTGVSDAVPALLGLLKDRDPLVVYDAARALGMLGDPAVIREVVSVICRQDEWSRAKIIELLLEFGPTVALETLRQFLSGNVAPNWMLPMIEIMGYFRVTEARPALEAVVRGEDENLSHAAIKALGRIGQPSSDWVLRACLVSPVPRIRQAAAEALGMCMAVRAEPDLVEMLNDDSKDARHAAATALLTFGESGEKRLWEVCSRRGANPKSRDAASWALQRVSWSRMKEATA